MSEKPGSSRDSSAFGSAGSRPRRRVRPQRRRKSARQLSSIRPRLQGLAPRRDSGLDRRKTETRSALPQSRPDCRPEPTAEHLARMSRPQLSRGPTRKARGRRPRALNIRSTCPPKRVSSACRRTRIVAMDVWRIRLPRRGISSGCARWRWLLSLPRRLRSRSFERHPCDLPRAGVPAGSPRGRHALRQRSPRFATAVIAFLAYDFLFVDPLYTFTINDPNEWLNLLLAAGGPPPRSDGWWLCRLRTPRS